jgi:hypothetical protein
MGVALAERLHTALHTARNALNGAGLCLLLLGALAHTDPDAAA